MTLLSTFAIFFVTVNSSFGLDRLEEILAAMSKAGDSLETLAADFEQVHHDHILEEEEKSSGKLYMKVPGNIRWEYAPPDSKVLLVRDDKILLYNPIAHQAQEFKQGQKRGAGAALLIGFGKSNAEIGKHYDVSLVGEDDLQVVLRLLPKPDSAASLFAAIDMTLNKENWTPDRTVFHELNKDTTILEFQDVRVNAPLPPKTFELELPPGVEIISSE